MCRGTAGSKDTKFRVLAIGSVRLQQNDLGSGRYSSPSSLRLEFPPHQAWVWCNSTRRLRAWSYRPSSSFAVGARLPMARTPKLRVFGPGPFPGTYLPNPPPSQVRERLRLLSIALRDRTAGSPGWAQSLLCPRVLCDKHRSSGPGRPPQKPAFLPGPRRVRATGNVCGNNRRLFAPN